jgi:hypothetical protein
MRNIQVTSVVHPFDESPLGTRTAEVFRRADSMGLLHGPIDELSATSLRSVAQQLSSFGLATDVAGRLRAADPSRADLTAYVDAASEALDQSPVPTAELTKLNALLGAELLAKLIHIGSASLLRYQKGERTTPDEIAARAHYLTKIVAHLEGTYNEFGVRRWFQRSRSRLEGQSPAESLAIAWSPNDSRARDVQALAESLEHLGAT